MNTLETLNQVIKTLTALARHIECSNWDPGVGGPINIHAQALGRLGRGKRKRLSPKERERRAEQAAIARAARIEKLEWSKPVSR